MKISEILKTRNPAFSFEFFPPKTEEDVRHLMKTAEALQSSKPAFISVTWGAGGGTRRRTIDIVCAIKDELKIETMAHLTCVGASRGELQNILDEIKSRGLDNVLALRGDPPKGQSEFTPHPEGFAHANELISFIKKKWDFCLGAAGYPEGHIECPDKDKDLDNLKRKADAGAEFILTQLFFDNGDFLRFRDKAESKGIRLPIIPGIMPITNVSQIKRFTVMCGAKIPAELLGRIDPIQEDKEAVVLAGIEHAAKQCRQLLEEGVPGIHFYTLNRSRSTAEILENLR